MVVAIIGSRNCKKRIPEAWVPKSTTRIISGGARGTDRMARIFALEHHILIHEILPDYRRYGRRAPLLRNDEIIARADLVIAIWDGSSRGTRYVIDRCKTIGKPLMVYALQDMD